MKSIDKLYQFLEDQFGSERFAIHSYGYTQGVAIAKLIEEEISDNYMRLPVDADGVPIHLYDKLLKSTGAAESTYGEVVGISDDSVFFNAKQGWESNWSKCTRHVKPRTLEDVFRDCCDEYHEACKSEYTMNPADIYRKYADEARELLGGDV